MIGFISFLIAAAIVIGAILFVVFLLFSPRAPEYRETLATLCVSKRKRSGASATAEVEPSLNEQSQHQVPRSLVTVTFIRPDRTDFVILEKDAWDPWFPAPSIRRRIHARLRVRYLDADQLLTDREISVRYIGNELEPFIKAYCHLRAGNRTFRPARMLSCIDIETGELISDPWGELNRRFSASEAKKSKAR